MTVFHWKSAASDFSEIVQGWALAWDVKALTYPEYADPPGHTQCSGSLSRSRLAGKVEGSGGCAVVFSACRIGHEVDFMSVEP